MKHLLMVLLLMTAVVQGKSPLTRLQEKLPDPRGKLNPGRLKKKGSPSAPARVVGAAAAKALSGMSATSNWRTWMEVVGNLTHILEDYDPNYSDPGTLQTTFKENYNTIVLMINDIKKQKNIHPQQKEIFMGSPSDESLLTWLIESKPTFRLLNDKDFPGMIVFQTKEMARPAVLDAFSHFPPVIQEASAPITSEKRSLRQRFSDKKNSIKKRLPGGRSDQKEAAQTPTAQELKQAIPAQEMVKINQLVAQLNQAVHSAPGVKGQQAFINAYTSVERALRAYKQKLGLPTSTILTHPKVADFSKWVLENKPPFDLAFTAQHPGELVFQTSEMTQPESLNTSKRFAAPTAASQKKRGMLGKVREQIKRPSASRKG